jgi:hypothetical protein
MTWEEGELEKRIYNDRTKKISEIIDEAKKEYPTVTKVLSLNPDFSVSFNAGLYDKWFKKWFGSSDIERAGAEPKKINV